MKHWSLAGFRAVVTGATRGIGLRRPASWPRSAPRSCSWRASRPTCRKPSGPSRDEGLRAHGCPADLSTESGRRAVHARVDELWGELHVLVNNVGMNIRTPTLEYPLESLRQLMSANVESAFGLCQLMHPHLRASHGAIVNVSSIASRTVVRMSTAAYSMTKGALDSMTDFLAVEWGADGIRVNAVHPWYIRTRLTEAVLSDEARRKRIHRVDAARAHRRAGGRGTSHRLPGHAGRRARERRARAGRRRVRTGRYLVRVLESRTASRGLAGTIRGLDGALVRAGVQVLAAVRATVAALFHRARTFAAPLLLEVFRSLQCCFRRLSCSGLLAVGTRQR